MKKILVLCPRERDYRELNRPEIIGNAQLTFHSFDVESFRAFIYPARQGTALDPAAFLEEIISLAGKEQVDTIISNEYYVGSIFASIASYELRLPAPSPESMLTCQHKYHARVAQKRYVPEATPHFQLVDPQAITTQSKQLSYPIFVKPIKASYSIGAEIIHSAEQLKARIQQLIPPAAFLQPLAWALKHYTDLDPRSDWLLVEELLEGVQTTVEGYAFDGQITIFGITDSIMYPGTISFEHFDYPSQLPESVQNRMATIAKQCMAGIGFDNGLFNMEFMYNEKKDTVHIIEINPRLASVYAHFYEHIDGTNSYKILCDIAQGVAPTIERGKGTYKVGASFVARHFEDKHVTAVPLEHDLEQVKKLFPNAQIVIKAKPGYKLSACRQDGKSFMYMVVDVVGNNKQELLAKHKQCTHTLPFSFESV